MDRSLHILPRYYAANIDVKTWTYQEHSQNEGEREAGVISCFGDFGTPTLELALSDSEANVSREASASRVFLSCLL